MKRRTILINSALGVALAGVAVVSAVSVSGAGRSAGPVGLTVRVNRGTVTSTVTATGNVDAATSVAVTLTGSAATVTAIYVRVGRRVAKGDRLLAVDDTSARAQLKTARANLDSARAQFDTAIQGRTAADRALDDAAVRSAQTAVDNAATALGHARQNYAQDSGQQQALVDAAEQSLREAQSQSPLIQSAVDSAASALAQAKRTRDKTLLADRQAIETQSGQLAAARNSLSAQQAQRTANQQPPKQGTVAQAQAQVDSAEVSVTQAEQAVRDTVLRAPVAGTVADIAAVIGQSSSTARSSGATSSGGSAGGSAGSGGAGGAAASTASGLVTLINPSSKEVTASVAEADVVKVGTGQPVAVSFPASGRSVDGAVTSIATQSSVVNNVVQYAVTVGLTAPPAWIRLGQTADVTITTASHSGVLYVPTSAISVGDGHATVTRRSAGTDSVVEVRTGLVGANGTEIVEGLVEGDEVVLPTGASSATYTFPGANGPSPAPSPVASR